MQMRGVVDWREVQPEDLPNDVKTAIEKMGYEVKDVKVKELN